MSASLNLVTRPSPLALWQATFVKRQLEALHKELTVNVLPISTKGDREQKIALNRVGGKTLFVKELQAVLLSGGADIAVHSVKDLAASDVPDLRLAAVLERGDVRDAFVSKKFSNFKALPPQAIIGTASPRRQSQLLKLRPDLNIKLLRGNVSTRLIKLSSGEYDAIVLAAAGLQRLNLGYHIRECFEREQLLPAIGQGAIGIECRAADKATQKLLAPLNHAMTAACICAERSVNVELGGDCFTPIAAYAFYQDNCIQLSARVGTLDGRKLLSASSSGTDPVLLGKAVAAQLMEKGAAQLLENL